MDDLIRKEDAIKAYNDNLETSECGTALNDDAYLKALKDIPAVEPREGEWIYVTVEEWIKTGRDYGHHCSECDEINESGKSNYCSNCGAKMKGENDEVLRQL